ncbi:hypothetical protein KXD97_32680 (plasmid) [Mycobacterium sp. SMC-8]|uniref:hypothetical protein n=1 Tax=Mycobacterium sp. SMC-8 TaxID=2857060 RepID=UPI0021B45E9E|nr:hypothetical protein [Mycobacterium sp. SMC-8]UXA15809.1 hypothetical protein KXD97_32680 [Mycobacterium sp. SMC-8]
MEGRSAEWGIAFERNERVPHGRALLVCDARAACIMTSHATAERLHYREDTAALWIAMSWAKAGQPVLVGLPAFGGDPRDAQSLPRELRDLGETAATLATSFRPPDPWGEDEDYGEDGDHDEDDDDEDDDEEYEETHYQWFMQEQARGVRWLSTFRTALIRELVTRSAANADRPSRAEMKATRQGRFAFVKNAAGGQLGKVQQAVRLPPGKKVRDYDKPDYVDVLVLACEHDRPAAVAAFEKVGITLPFDPAPGWLDAVVEPGVHGQLDITWRGTVRGVSIKLELATLHIYTGRLAVAAAELSEPIDILLRRSGFHVNEVQAALFPRYADDLYGMELDSLTTLMHDAVHSGPLIDTVEATTSARPRPLLDPNSFESLHRRNRRRQNRRLRSAARSLLPAPWAQEIEAVWRPGLPTGAAVGGELPTIDKIAPGTGMRQVSCRLCDATVVQRTPDTHVYCHDCCTDAREGLFYDRGFDEPWVAAAVWSLRTLAEIEFGGPPAKPQLAQLPEYGPQSDLLMLCRMLTARVHHTELGAERKSYAWTDWLSQAQLLTDGVRTGRGVTVVAKDGHLCRSLLERQVDDFFHDHEVAHEPEPHYPFDARDNPNGYRADWRLSDGTFVEALGFPNDPAYMAKANRKMKLAARYNIPVVTLTHADTSNLPGIFSKWL